MADRPYETRTVTASVEYRDDAEAPTIIGHAATFNQPYDVGFFTETIHPDAFKRTLSLGPDVRLLVDHEGQPLARTKSGTLKLGTDSRGLTVEASLDPTDPDVQRLLPKMRRGDMDQMSFAFRVPAGGDAWDHTGDMPKRTIREANLAGGDVSIVTYPANENASVALRSRESRDAHLTYLRALLDEIYEGRDIDETRFAEVMRELRGHPEALEIAAEAAATANAELAAVTTQLEAAVRAAETPEQPNGYSLDHVQRLLRARQLRHPA